MMGLSDSIDEQDRTNLELLRIENEKLKRTMRLHAGDCCSLSNEADLFKDHWDDAERRVDELFAKNKQLEKAILDFGNNPAGFDWAVLDRIDTLEIENERLINLLWKMRGEHIENRMSSFGRVLDYINEAIGADVIAEKVKQALKD